MAIVENTPGKITLSFWRWLKKPAIEKLKSKKVEYDTVADAYSAALEALDKYPQIDFVHIDFTPTSSYIRRIEKIERGPVF